MNFRKALSILSVLLILAGIHLFFYAQNISLKYQITDLKVKLNELISQDRLLGSLVSREENLSYVEKIAKGKLGMIYPEKIIYIAGQDQSRSGSGSGETVPEPR